MYVCMYVLFPVTMDVLGESYVLKGMARSLNHHFTVAIKGKLYGSLGVNWWDVCFSKKWQFIAESFA